MTADTLNRFLRLLSENAFIIKVTAAKSARENKGNIHWRFYVFSQ